jgi:peptidylprolyl isomerase
MKRSLLLTALLATALTGCSGESTPKDTLGAPSPTVTSPGPCKAATSPNKDLTSKPTFTASDCAAPAETFSTDVVVGTGLEAKEGSNVEVQYLGVDYATGTEFDSSWAHNKQPLPFTVGSGVIPGFSTGVTGMKVGGRRLVVIPPKDGYGDSGPVPGGTLAFVIDLVKVS